jgi:Spy/CpxP family protein refolding chaperone
MKTNILILLGCITGLCLSTGAFAADDDNGGDRPQAGDEQAVSAEKQAEMKKILSNYDPAALTAADAKAIHRALHAAGVHGGPAENELLKSSGFDPETLRKLDPPPDKKGHAKGDAERQGKDDSLASGEGQEGGQQTADDSAAAGGGQEDANGREDARQGEEAQDRDDGRQQAGQDDENASGRPDAAGDENGGGRGGPSGGEHRGGRKESITDKYNLKQAVSDTAQLHTIAFNGLAFLTGDFGAATFIPPGKVCDFFGFQYMRDIDAAQKGHNPIFLSRVAGNVAHILTAEQKKMFSDLAEEQMPQLAALAKMRLPLIKAFYLQKDGKLPEGSSGLNKAAVMNYVGDIFAKDEELSQRRAEVMAKVYLSLSAEQKAYFAKMKFGDFNTWPALDETQAKEAGRGKPKMFNVAYMTYLSEFFSWTAGSVDADTYFCPERHGTYFGGFYMKDMPAMGKRNYNISTTVTGDSGQAFIEVVLTAAQRKNITEIAQLQRQAMADIITVRRAISQELRKYLKGQTPDRAKLLALGRRYGTLDGEVSWYYTTAFARVNKTLTSAQRAKLMKLRNLDGYTSAPYYIYSEAMKNQPDVTGAETLFFPPAEK